MISPTAISCAVRHAFAMSPLGGGTATTSAAREEAPLEPGATVRERVAHSRSDARILGEVQRILHDRARGDEVAAAMLVELGQLLPRARIEAGVARRLFPHGARHLPP